MRTLMFLLVVAAMATTVSCVKVNAFKCDGDDNACGADGRCESDGFCSIPSDSCSTGRQYSDTAGDLANQCVGGGPNPDGPIPDGPETDGPQPDGPPTGCNGDFQALAAGGNPNHKYKLITVAAPWLTQQNTVCVGANNSYLAIPDDGGELTGLFALAGAPTWFGVNDRIDEGVYREVKNNTIYTALPIDDGNGNQNGQDCVGTLAGVALETDDCDTSRIVVCECEE